MFGLIRRIRNHIDGFRTMKWQVMRMLNRITAIQVAQELDRLRDRSERTDHPLRLTRHERQVFSQFGEDGITIEIFRRIGTTNRQFVEFGIGNGLENNTVYLLMTGWQGLWMDLDEAGVANVRREFSEELANQTLRLLHTAVTPENVEQLFERGGVPEEPDLLSIDIDGNDYYVWQAISRYRPRVVVIEYNSLYPPEQRWRMRYAPEGVPVTSHFGASLASLTDLAAQKGYALVACSLGGANAFYVRQDLVTPERFAAPFTPENHYEPPRYYLSPEWTGHGRRNGPRILD